MTRYVPAWVKSIFPDDGIVADCTFVSRAPVLAKPSPWAVSDSVIVPGGSLGNTPCAGKLTPSKPLARPFSTEVGPKVAVWVSKLSLDIWKVTVVLALTVSVAGNIVNNSTPPGADSPRLTVLAGNLALDAFKAPLIAAVP